MVSNYRDRLLKALLLSKKIRAYGKPVTLNSEAGLTLTELLVVIVIIGILAAVGLSASLSIVARARVSRAQSNVGSVNDAQRRYFINTQSFATALNQLAAGVPAITEDYTYGTQTVGTGLNQYALSTATPTGDNPTQNGVAGKVFLVQTALGEVDVQSVLCTGNPGQVPEMATVQDETQCP